MLRPLRVISRVPQLKVVVNTIFQSTPMLGNVVAIASVFFLIFGILGMRLFMGKFHSCTDPDIQARAEADTKPHAGRPFHAGPACGGLSVASGGDIPCHQTHPPHIHAPARRPPPLPQTQWECTGFYSEDVTIPRSWNATSETCNDARVFRSADCRGVYNTTQELPRYWTSEYRNFDNIGNAMLTLFEISSGEGWVSTMWNGVDARGPDLAMMRDHNLPAAVFFIVFMVVGMLFFVNLFVGIMVMSFQSQQQQQRDGEATTGAGGGAGGDTGDGNGMMTNEQKAWVRAQKVLRTAKPVARADIPTTLLRRIAWNISRNPLFDWIITGSIIANVFLLALEYEGMDDRYAQGLEAGNLVFTVIFTLEAAIKIGALYPREYFKHRWNVFDFTVVFASIVALGAGVGGFASVLRILRLLRLFKLAKQLRGAHARA